MSTKPLLFEFDKSGSEGINIPIENKWNDISSNSNVLKNINFGQDKEAKNKIEVKSIPSPYARMILFKNAFEDQYFPKDKKLEIFEDILDAMEMIFLHKITKFDDKLRIMDINLSTSISGNSTHRKYIKTLNDLSETYKVEKDGRLERYNSFSIVYLNNGHDNSENIIAGTSPYTCFFTPEKINVAIEGYFEYETLKNGTKKRVIKSFSERNKYFLRFLFDFYKRLPDSSKQFMTAVEKRFKDFKEFNIEDIRRPSTTNGIRDNVTQEEYRITIIPNLNFPLYDGKIELNSYYKLLPTLNSKEIYQNSGVELPLVLTTNNTNEDYYDGEKFPTNWDVILKESIVNDKNTERKNLPGTIKKYPWLAPMTDFFEEKLIKLPYSLDSKSMYDGDNNNINNFPFLIPLSEKFFEYFRPEDIEKMLSYRPNVSENNIESDSVELILRIPIYGYTGDGKDTITIKKLYSGDSINYQCFTKDMSTGQYIKNGIYSALWPTILNNKSNNLIERYYLLEYEHTRPIDEYWKDSKFFNYLTDENNVTHLLEIKNTNNSHTDLMKENRDKLTRIYSLRYPPELIQMNSINGAKGYFLPKFNSSYSNIDNSSKRKVYVGIDFGTSNTVIAYKENLEGNDINLMPITSSNFCKFHGNTTKDGAGQFEIVIKMFFVPFEHGINVNNEFLGRPFSTEVCYFAELTTLKHPILHGNITFNRSIPKDLMNEIKTNLKWAGTEQRNVELIALFFKELKAIIEKYCIEKRIPVANISYRYSYPLSFDNDQIDNLNKIFESFGEKTKLDESQCSVKYFTKFEKGVFAITNSFPAITIDIGGGTSDIVGYRQNKTMFKNSVLFGGQDIFNDIIGNNEINNPIVLSLKNYVLDKANTDSELSFVYDKTTFLKYKDSHSLFSYIVSRSEFNNVKIGIHETEFYKYFRLLILYFFSGIFYFTALNLKKYLFENNNSESNFNNIGIGIGGNGSRLLKWISRDEDWGTFTKKNPIYSTFINNIFKAALEIESDKFSIELKLSQSPKEEVVRGLLIEDNDADLTSGNATNQLLTGENLTFNSNRIDKFSQSDLVNRSNYAELKFENFKESEINKFNNIFIKNFMDNMGEYKKDLQKAYIEKFIEIIQNTDEEKLLSGTSKIIQSHFALKNATIADYNNSYFITEVKAMIEIIKDALSSSDYLGGKI